MNITKATYDNLGEVMKIYDHARSFMAETGNPNQWYGGYPSEEIVKSDIAKKQLYILSDEDGIEGVFVFFDGVEPDYLNIEGKWLSDKPYLTVHRVASAGKKKGVLGEVISYCLQFGETIRIDTHEDNVIMQNALKKQGFKRCGIVHTESGTRIGFQR